MQPTFRSDLHFSREEQEGVTFYRVDDPVNHTTFRLYEIEYLIAQKLDGKNSLRQVADAVRDQHHFEVSEPDLFRFVGQLGSMGFVEGDLTPTASVAPLEAMGVVDANTDDMQLGNPTPGPMRNTLGSSHVDPAELARLLKSAFLHVRQGYLVHAKDFLLAAKEMDPSDPRLAGLASSVDVLGDNPTPGELQQVWRQCLDMFPDLARDIAPMLNDSRSGTAARLSQAAERSTQASNRDLRLRLGLSLFLLAIVVFGAAGLWYTARTLHLLEGPIQVQVATLEGLRVPIYFANSASSVAPLEEGWLSFGVAGTLPHDLPQVGTKVTAGAILCTQTLPPKQALFLQRHESFLVRAQAGHEKVAKKLEKLLQERQSIEGERTMAETKIHELRPQNVLRQDRQAQHDLDLQRRHLAAANKKLSRLSRRERGPRLAEERAKKKVDLLQNKIAQIHAQLGGRSLRANFAGEVVEVKATAGQPIAAAAPVVLLRNRTKVRLRFQVDTVGTLQVGGEALLSVQQGRPVPAKVTALKSGKGSTDVALELSDPAGALQSLPGKAFRMVREVADPAFQVRPDALVGLQNGTARLLRLRQDHVVSTPVEVLERRADQVLVRDPSGQLRQDGRVVIGRQDGQALATLVDGTAVVVPAQARR